MLPFQQFIVDNYIKWWKHSYFLSSPLQLLGLESLRECYVTYSKCSHLHSIISLHIGICKLTWHSYAFEMGNDKCHKMNTLKSKSSGFFLLLFFIISTKKFPFFLLSTSQQQFPTVPYQIAELLICSCALVDCSWIFVSILCYTQAFTRTFYHIVLNIINHAHTLCYCDMNNIYFFFLTFLISPTTLPNGWREPESDYTRTIKRNLVNTTGA